MRFAATTIDLGSLPKPNIIESLSFEEILEASKADVIARGAKAGITIDSLDLETELMTIVLQSCAFREVLCRQRVNDGALALLLAFSKGSDLDHVAARFGVTRMVVYASDGVTVLQRESDDRLRRRTQLAPDAYSNAGTLRGYEHHALSASLEIDDAHVFSPEPGKIAIVLLSATGAPTDAAFDAVYGRVTATDVKPLTDDVRVSKANVIPYTVSGILRVPRGPDPAIIKNLALDKARAYGASVFKVGRKVYRSGYYGALQVPNVFEAVLLSPAENLDPGDYGVGKPSFNIMTEVVDG